MPLALAVFFVAVPCCMHGCEQGDALEDALRQLYLLEAIDASGAITQLGRHMAHLPLEPPLGRTLIAAQELGCLSEALTIVAMLSAEYIFQGSRCAALASCMAYLGTMTGSTP